MNKEVDTYKIFRQLEERRKRSNLYTFYDKDELVDEILKLEDNLDQLTNNWNELEETIRKDHEECKNIYDNFEKSITIYTKTLLDRMKEIKEGKNESK